MQGNSRLVFVKPLMNEALEGDGERRGMKVGEKRTGVNGREKSGGGEGGWYIPFVWKVLERAIVYQHIISISHGSFMHMYVDTYINS